jgi:trimeric autotransporter adhesin
MYMNFGCLAAVLLAGAALFASEHHGVVQSGGLPVPGATVTATQGSKKLVTTTDDQGAYGFADLPDGVWTITVDMLGFAKLSEEVGVAAMAPSPTWNLKLLSAAEVKSAVAALKTPAPAAPATIVTASAQPAPAAPAKNDETKPNPTATASVQPDKPAAAPAAGGRGTANGSRPSIRSAVAQNGRGGQNGFQRMDVNASQDAGAAGQQDAQPEMASPDLAQSSNDAFVVGGSISSGVAMPQQNDWFGGRGPGDGMFGPGGMGMGMGGPGGDGMQSQDGAPAGGGRGGPGGGGPGGGRGGFGGPGGGGPGGGGFGGGGGRGNFAGGRGGRDGQNGRGGRNTNAFGNGRRDARMRYNGNIAVIYDNSAMDARSFSLTGQDTPKPSTANARMTAMFGGPLKIPHLLDGKKTTFNVNYQFTRARTGNVISSLVPTADERAGNFANVTDLQGKPVTIYDPTSGIPFTGNSIPQNRISPQATGLLAFYPLPNFSGTNQRYNYQTSLVGVNNQDNVNTRISHTVNTKNQINGNFSYQRADGSSPNLFNFVTSNHQSAYNTGVNWTYHFTTRLFNTASLNFSRNSQSTTPFFANRTNISGELGITGNDQNPNFWGPPSLGFANGFASLSDGNTVFNRAQTTAFSESVRWFHDKHNFTFGGDTRRILNSPISQQNPRGSFNFTGSLTSLNGVGGFDMADFLLGLPATSNIAYGNADKYFNNGWYSLYGTDDWRLTTKLSLTLGLRWDYQLPTTEKYGRLVNMNIGPGFTTATAVCATSVAGCTPASQAGFTNSLMNGDAREIQPRIGFAWRPINKGTLVIRGGYGLYYNTTAYQSIVSQMSQQSPLSYSLIDSAAIVPLTLANGFPVVNKTPVTTFAVDPNFRIGYVHSWQLAVQQNLPWSLVGTVTYSGAKGTHQMQEFIPNSAPAGTTYYCTTCPSNFYYMTTGGNTISNNIWLQLQRRFRSGFSGNLMYMHANSIDDGSAGGGGRGGGNGSAALIAQNWLDLDAERARSSGIREHTMNAMMQYSTGMGARGGALMKGLKGTLLRDWTVTSTFTVASGAPLTPGVISKALGGTGIIGPLRANYTGLPVYNPDGTLNPAAFGLPTAGTYGDAGRNTITGPMIFSMNASAGRIIRIGERKSVDLRIDSRNPLNHVVFTSWNTTVGSTQFGLPSSVNPMRSLTATLRFRF